ncbi:MAG: MFS transporter [Bacteroidota bacterium]|nr:MFS transporter [Bacteroidota bacterium]
MSDNLTDTQKPKGVIQQTITEVTQPFKDLFKASRALWGVNVSYLLEGLIYFGMLTLLTLYFNDYVKLNDINAGQMVGFLTAGITFSMLLLGAAVDIVGVRMSMIVSVLFMLAGRVLLTLAPSLSSSTGFYSTTNLLAVCGMLGIIIGYGMYQPACYAAVKEFTSEKNSAMGYAMLYALMNLGGFLPGLISPPIRRSFGMIGVFWAYNILTFVGLLVIVILITKKAMAAAKKQAELDTANETPKLHQIAAEPEVTAEPETLKEKFKYYFKNFPLRDKRFLFFIFILIPVQTLFAHNWLTLPAYCKRAFTGLVSDNFELFVNINPILIFILTPMIAALTIKKDTYRMMILGTLVMASPTFLLAMGPSIYTLFAFSIIMTIGEAMWQPRFLQWVAEIAPKGMTGIYMGIGQFPWFLTKVVTSLYSGWFLMHYCPEGVTPDKMNTQFMWMIYGFIAIISPIGLFLARKWMIKGFKVKAN